MSRKDKIKLLNGILKGETPISAVFDKWPEISFYEMPDDDGFYKTQAGEVVSVEEVDHKLMNYPKVHIVSQPPKEKEPNLDFCHKYFNKDGEEITEEEFNKKRHSREPPESEYHGNLQPPSPAPDSPSAIIAAQDPKPPPEPFLSRKDREVLAQGPLYCLR